MLNALIIFVSFGLFVYSFRYMCIMILRDRGGRNYAGQIATANQLDFLRAEELLSPAEDADPAETPSLIKVEMLDRVEEALDRDYRVVSYLLQNAAACYRYRSIEQIVLSVAFGMMRLRYRLLRLLSPPMARTTLLEMAQIVRHLAQSAGERLVARKA